MTSTAAEPSAPSRVRHRRALELAALGVAAVPQMHPVSVVGTRATRDGVDTAVVRDAASRDWVVAAPRVAAAGAEIEAEVAVLGLVNGRVSFATPDPQGHAKLRGGGRALVYQALPGSPVSLPQLSASPRLAKAVGRAIASVHALNPDDFAGVGVPVYDSEGLRRRCLAALDRGAEAGVVPAGLLARWEARLEDVSSWRFQSCPVHGELVSDRVLVDGDAVSGVIDWSGARVSDPAEDLAWIAVGADADGIGHVLSGYRALRRAADPHLVERAVLHGEMALMTWLLHGMRVDDQRIVGDATSMLEQLAQWHDEHAPALQPPPSRVLPDSAADLPTAPMPLADAPSADPPQVGALLVDALLVDAPPVDPTGVTPPFARRSAAGWHRPGQRPDNQALENPPVVNEPTPNTSEPSTGRTSMSVSSAPRYSATRFAATEIDDTDVIDLTQLRAHLASGNGVNGVGHDVAGAGSVDVRRSNVTGARAAEPVTGGSDSSGVTT